MIEILKPGFLSLVQDAGRKAYMDCGVPVSGAMDSDSYLLANWLVGNSLDAAVLEVTLIGPQILFTRETCIGITGAAMSATIDNKPVTMYETIKVSKGSVLKFGSVKTGCRTYISFEGGLNVSKELGSRSTYVYAKLGGVKGRALQKGDCIPLGKTTLRKFRKVPLEYHQTVSSIIVLRVLPSIEHTHFEKESIAKFYSTEYTIGSQSNRMGYRLEGARLAINDHKELVSSGIVQGTIQIPSNGQPIILLSDAQTTGGYPRIANVIAADLSLLAQQKPGDRVRFRKVSLEEAHHLNLIKTEKFAALL